MTNFNQDQTKIFLHYFRLEVVHKFREYPNASFMEVFCLRRNLRKQKGILIDFILPEMIYYNLKLNYV